jgi:hypothetical protein
MAEQKFFIFKKDFSFSTYNLEETKLTDDDWFILKSTIIKDLKSSADWIYSYAEHSILDKNLSPLNLEYNSNKVIGNTFREISRQNFFATISCTILDAFGDTESFEFHRRNYEGLNYVPELIVNLLEVIKNINDWKSLKAYRLHINFEKLKNEHELDLRNYNALLDTFKELGTKYLKLIEAREAFSNLSEICSDENLIKKINIAMTWQKK